MKGDSQKCEKSVSAVVHRMENNTQEKATT